MLRRPARLLILGIAALAVVLLAVTATAELYTEALWFGSLGRSSVLWTRIGASLAVRLGATLLGGALVLANLWLVIGHLGPIHLRRRYGNLEIAEQIPRRYVHAAIAVIAALTGWWLSGIPFGGAAPLEVLAWLRRVPFGVEDPLFGRDLSFFVFGLPVYYRILDYILLATLWSLLLVAIGYVLVGAVRLRGTRLEVDDHPRVHFALGLSLLLVLLAIRYWLDRYGLLIEGSGFQDGTGYTDVAARLPAYRVLALLSLAAAFALAYGALRRTWWPPIIAVGLLVAGLVGLGAIYPSIIQQLRVEPNELARESAYIDWRIEFTRLGFGLDELERRSYRPAGALPAWREMTGIDRLGLWDSEPLRTALNQIQAVTRFYQFADVDNDRYGPPGERRPVAIAVRELDEDGLDQRTWQNVHLTYVHGIGAVAAPLDERTADGDAVLWLRDNPAVRSPDAVEGIELTQPRVYFGETMSEYVVVRDSAGATEDLVGQVTTGVPLTSFLRTLAFAWRFSDRNLLFSREITDRSRMLFRRQLVERVSRLLPIVAWDRDALPVLVEGRIVWLLDGYAVTASFPLAEQFGLGDANMGVRYVRNSVKATVDAVSGDVRFYALDGEEPLLRTYRHVFPGLIEPLEAMPAELRAHLRYPTLLFRLQAQVLAEYHVDTAAEFYSGEDAWQLPGAAATQPAQPTSNYLITRLPGEVVAEFLVLQPLVARQRQVMTGLLVAGNEEGGYGPRVLLQLPAGQQVPGPAQIEALIEQDPAISTRLSLWREGGRTVQLGRLRVVPLDSALLYVQPLFLSSTQSGIPQLQQVLASDGRAVSMAPTLEEAVRALQRGETGVVDDGGEAAVTGAAVGATTLQARALQLLDEAERRLRAGDWAGFGRAWEELRQLLRSAVEAGARE